MKQFALLILFLIAFTGIKACEITLEVEKGAKEKYVVGDEFVIKVNLKFSHRVCNLSLEETKYEVKGLEILGGTDWKESSVGSWERKIKVKVTGTPDGKLTFNIVRTCDKMGGFATMSFLSKPVKAKKQAKVK
jgi:hypothetical protein